MRRFLFNVYKNDCKIPGIYDNLESVDCPTELPNITVKVDNDNFYVSDSLSDDELFKKEVAIPREYAFVFALNFLNFCSSDLKFDKTLMQIKNDT